MAERYGTDLTALGGYEGGVNADNGAALVSTSSDGETALLFGPAALRAIHGGITNGDFAAVPDEPDTDISDDNALPYFKWDNSSGTAFSAIIATDNAFVENNQTVRILVGTAITSGTAILSRIEPLGATGGVGNAFLPFATFSGNSSAGTGVKVKVEFEFLGSDQETVLGTPLATAEVPWEDSSGEPSYLYATFDGQPGYLLPQHASPPGAEYIKTKVVFEATAAGGSGYDVAGFRSIDIVDIGLERGSSTVLINEDVSPDDFAAGHIQQFNGTIQIVSGKSDYVGADNAQIFVGVEDFTMPDRGQIVLDANTGEINLLADGGVTTNSSLDVAGSIDATGAIAVARASALDLGFTARGTADGTPRFAVFCNGVMEWGAGGTRDLNLYRSAAGVLRTDFKLEVGNGSIGSNGTFNGLNANLTGANGLRHDAPATTTATSNAAIWVVVSGTNRQLRRNTSSARYKTNIVDADEVVLEAARKVKPRHFESTIEDENGATRLGFIAEEIHDAGLTHAVGYDAEGKPETIDPVALIAALWHRVSDLEDRLKALEAE